MDNKFRTDKCSMNIINLNFTYGCSNIGTKCLRYELWDRVIQYVESRDHVQYVHKHAVIIYKNVVKFMFLTLIACLWNSVM